MLKKLQATFFGLSLLGLALIIAGMIVNTDQFWIVTDVIVIIIFAGSAAVHYQSLRK